MQEEYHGISLRHGSEASAHGDAKSGGARRAREHKYVLVVHRRGGIGVFPEGKTQDNSRERLEATNANSLDLMNPKEWVHQGANKNNNYMDQP